MKTGFNLICVLLMAAGLTMAEEVHPTDAQAVLTVHVTNGTAGGSVAAGTLVTVNFYHEDHIAKQASVQTDAEGNCVIGDIPVGANMVAIAQARHSDMAFSSPPLHLDTGQKQYNLSLQVFDIAYDNSLIHVGTHHLILQKIGSKVQISEFVQLINETDKAVLSDDEDENGRPVVVSIDLPENADDLLFSGYFQPQAIVRTAAGFYDTMAIPPGSYHAVFSYDIPLSDETTNFNKTITLPTQNLMVFVQTGAGITAPLGEPTGQMTLKDGTQTDYYMLGAAQEVSLPFEAQGIPEVQSGRNVWIILGVVFAVVAAAVIFRIFKQHQLERKCN